MSVRLTTPTSRPESRAPGSAEAGIDGALRYAAGAALPLLTAGEGGGLELVTSGICTDECDGVGGPDEDGDSGSVTQRLVVC